jgi:hypothetical protein
MGMSEANWEVILREMLILQFQTHDRYVEIKDNIDQVHETPMDLKDGHSQIEPLCDKDAEAIERHHQVEGGDHRD